MMYQKLPRPRCKLSDFKLIVSGEKDYQDYTFLAPLLKLTPLFYTLAVAHHAYIHSLISLKETFGKTQNMKGGRKK